MALLGVTSSYRLPPKVGAIPARAIHFEGGM